MSKSLKNGDTWFDTDGNILHAHGGYILKDNDFYYWYGENRLGDIYVSCYRSTDLLNWEFRNNVLTKQSKSQGTRMWVKNKLINDDGGKVNIERPKVLYNDITKKYVMWMHFENGKDYNDAQCAVATCDSPDGDFVYHGSFNPFGYMSRDCTLFKDDDGTAYFVSAARNNADIHIYKLQNDYLNVKCIVNKLFSNEYREAPAICKKDNRYYMLTSHCSGWKPNQCKYSYADKMDGEWQDLIFIGDKSTYKSQPAFLLRLPNDEILYVGDRWGGNDFWTDQDKFDYHASTYVFLKLEFKSKTDLVLNFKEDFML